MENIKIAKNFGIIGNIGIIENIGIVKGKKGLENGNYNIIIAIYIIGENI